MLVHAVGDKFQVYLCRSVGGDEMPKKKFTLVDNKGHKHEIEEIVSEGSVTNWIATELYCKECRKDKFFVYRKESEQNK
jgi:hypothetical protein